MVGQLLLVTVALAHPADSCRMTPVTFPSAELRLAGTVYQPTADTAVPGVVLIHGSGEVGRETMTWMAEWLCERGIAALAYDKRGVGESEGADSAWRRFDLDDLAQDAAAGLVLLRTIDGIDSTRLGLFGASQGGWVAPIAAARDGRVAFLIQLSASVSTIAEDNVFERGQRLLREGFTAAEVEAVRQMHLLDIEVTRSGTRFEEFAKAWHDARDARWFPRVYGGDAPTAVDAPYRLWYRHVMDRDPVPLLAELRIPSLWLYGDPARDRFTPVALSLQRLEGLRIAGAPIEVHSFPGGDHNMRLPSGDDVPFFAVLAAWLGRHVTE